MGRLRHKGRGARPNRSGRVRGRRGTTMSNRIRVGTSGWHYPHWQGPFYPQKIASKQMLDFYSQRLRTVEINNSFYHLPAQETFRQWRRETPEGFLFAVKASR